MYSMHAHCIWFSRTKNWLEPFRRRRRRLSRLRFSLFLCGPSTNTSPTVADSGNIRGQLSLKEQIIIYYITHESMTL